MQDKDLYVKCKKCDGMGGAMSRNCLCDHGYVRLKREFIVEDFIKGVKHTMSNISMAESMAKEIASNHYKVCVRCEYQTFNSDGSLNCIEWTDEKPVGSPRIVVRVTECSKK